jgi:hypothetical protein
MERIYTMGSILIGIMHISISVKLLPKSELLQDQDHQFEEPELLDYIVCAKFHFLCKKAAQKLIARRRP